MPVSAGSAASRLRRASRVRASVHGVGPCACRQAFLAGHAVAVPACHPRAVMLPSARPPGDTQHEGICAGRDHRRRRRRRQRPLPPGQDRLDRRAAAREERADLRLDLARRRRHAHLQRRGQHLAAAEVHDRPLSRDRGAVRPVLRPAPERRPDAGGDAGRARQPEADLLARALPRHGDRDDHARGGARAQPADRPAALHRRAVARGRRPLRSVRHHARLRQGRAQARRRGRALHARRSR